LLKCFKYENIFAVGDPRQAIYGWRGSEISYILDFPKIFTPEDTSKTQVIGLEMNYRSNSAIVDFFNSSIKSLGLADLKSGMIEENSELGLETGEKVKVVPKVFLIEQDSELLERRFVLEAIKNSKNPRNEIFVLARTNRVLSEFAKFFKQNGVFFTIKSEEEYKTGEPQTGEVVLATVHSIKGMEAKEVFWLVVIIFHFQTRFKIILCLLLLRMIRIMIKMLRS